MLNSAVRLLDRAAHKWPEKTALSDESESLSFAVWRRESRAAATALLRAGIANAYGVSPVVIYLPKSVRALVAFMGVLYSGNPYVPVDAHIPMQRLEKILSSLRPRCIITSRALHDNLTCDLSGVTVLDIEDLAAHETDEAACDRAVAAVIDTDPIYVMFTSGSTGTPKGVTVPHRGVIDYAYWVCEHFGFDDTTVMAGQAPFYFDNSIFDIYGTLLSGATLELIPEALLLFPGKLPEFLADKHITSIFWVPTVIINVANSGALEGRALPDLRSVAFCGEIMPNKPLNVWRRALPQCRYVNMYGPTEISDVCTYFDVDRPFDDTDPLPIGRACENSRILILTPDGTPAKTGEQGEICVAGAGVALGYWGAWDISDKGFTPNPACPAFPDRIYHTGDLGYVAENGEIMFIGRSDTQIKLKGNRIELGELENAATCIEGVTRACAIFLAEQEKIVLVIESKDTHTLRRFNLLLKQYVPNYMLPGALVVRERLPLTANDKIDRVTLRGEIMQTEEGK